MKRTSTSTRNNCPLDIKYILFKKWTCENSEEERKLFKMERETRKCKKCPV